MGRQINLYLTPRDLAFLEGVLRKDIDFVAAGTDSDERRALVVGSLAVEDMGKSPLKLLVFQPSDAANLVFRSVSEGSWSVDTLRSPVVELSRCYFNGSTFRRGRIYYRTGYYMEDGSGVWVDKPASFLEWADRLFAAVRKNLRRDSGLGAYCGPEAWNLRADKSIEMKAL